MAPLTPWKIFIRSLLICLVLGIIFFGIAMRKIEILPLSGSPLQFNANNAYSYMHHLAKTFPNRLPWNENKNKAAGWLKKQFTQMGYAPKEMVFSENIAGKQYSDLQNIYAETRGILHPNEIIVVMAHYDTADTTSEGAMDDASGVGVVLELARIFANAPPERTVLFLLTDSEEFGAFWGAKIFADAFDRANQIVAAASFDFVGPKNQIAILTFCDGLKQGFTPLWLREMALSSIRSIGNIEARDLNHFVEFIQRALLIPSADHGAFLAAGIPAFNWVGQTENFSHQMAYYHHTPNDVAEIMEPRSFETYGKAGERLIRSISALPKIPENFRNSSYWKITQNLYMDGWGVTLLHILGFLPFLFYCISKFKDTFKTVPTKIIIHIFKSELKNIGIVLGSLLIGYAVMRLLPALKVITQYEIFPATQKSLILYTPNILAILLVLACVLLVYWIFKVTFTEVKSSSDHLEIRHAFYGILLALVILLAFLGNSYLAVLFLLPPSYLWMILRTRKNHKDRLLNTLLLFGGAVSFVLTALLLSTLFHVGIFYWYLFLSAVYGLISVYSMILFLVVITIMLRLFRNFVLSKDSTKML